MECRDRWESLTSPQHPWRPTVERREVGLHVLCVTSKVVDAENHFILLAAQKRCAGVDPGGWSEVWLMTSSQMIFSPRSWRVG